MKLLKSFICLACLVATILGKHSSPTETTNGTNHDRLDHAKVLSRQKRFLIFPPTGIVKVVAGLMNAVQLSHKRNLVCAYNFQAQFLLPTKVSTIFDRFSRRANNGEARNLFDESDGGRITGDASRHFVYTAIETFLNRQGRNGRQCLQRAICETAEASMAHNGVFGEILDAVFTPGSEEIHPHYKEARQAGRAGVDCVSVYPKCPVGQGILEQISIDDIFS